MALVSLDPARCLAWSEPGHGMVIFSGAGTPATLKKGGVRSAPTDRPWPRARHRPGCFARLHSRDYGPVPMAPARRCRDTIRYRDLETLACATPHLGRYAGQFLGSDHLVMAHGERTWSRAHGRAGTSRREICFLRSSSSSTNSLLSFHPLIATAAVGVHTISHLVIAGLVAWIVYDFIGLAVLRRSWINLDLIWCFSLLGAAVILFFAPLA